MAARSSLTRETIRSRSARATRGRSGSAFLPLDVTQGELGRKGRVDQGLTIQKLVRRHVDAHDQLEPEDRLAQGASGPRPRLARAACLAWRSGLRGRPHEPGDPAEPPAVLSPAARQRRSRCPRRHEPRPASAGRAGSERGPPRAGDMRRSQRHRDGLRREGDVVAEAFRLDRGFQRRQTLLELTDLQ